IKDEDDLYLVFFFFQAEDGIRDRNVTGVQTCALPILWQIIVSRTRACGDGGNRDHGSRVGVSLRRVLAVAAAVLAQLVGVPAVEIGRASCRERVEVWVGGGWWCERRDAVVS